MTRNLLRLSLTLLLGGAIAGCAATPTPDRGPPITSPDQEVLQIAGRVAEPLGWPEPDLRAMYAIQVQVTDERGEEQTHTGVPIRWLLAHAGPEADATRIVFVADDGYTAEAPLAEVLDCLECIISLAEDGRIDVVMPGFPGALQVRGVAEFRVQ